MIAQPSVPTFVGEAMKKTGVIWVGLPDGRQPMAMWHAWVDGVAYLLTGKGEQPDPGLTAGATALVIVRSKDTEQRLASWVAATTRVRLMDADWRSATDELVKGRLNLVDAQNAAARWALADDIVIWRLIPTGGIVEGPGQYADATFAGPVPSPATTAPRGPFVLGPKGGHGRSLT